MSTAQRSVGAYILHTGGERRSWDLPACSREPTMLGDRIHQLRRLHVRLHVRDELRHATRDTAERRSSRSRPTRVATRDPICVLIKHERGKIGI